jgi:hypothetical protein
MDMEIEYIYIVRSLPKPMQRKQAERHSETAKTKMRKKNKHTTMMD